MTQHKSFQLEINQLKSENKELKSANDLILSNMENIQKSNDHLQSKISKLTNELDNSFSELSKSILDSQSKELVLQQKISKINHELQNKSTIFVSKERKIFKVFEQLRIDVNKVEKERTNFCAQIKCLEDKCLQLQSNETSLTKNVSDLEIELQTQTKTFQTQNHCSNDDTSVSYDLPKEVVKFCTQVMFDALSRITNFFSSDAQLLEKAMQKSFLVSADMAHALHPNYMDKHEENHQPKLHGGLVIKHNANQRYATNAVTAFIFREIATNHNLPVQDFVVRNDMPCGSTIGPILASGTGIRTVDIGAPQLSMHSIREMCAVDDVNHSYKHLKAFYEDFTCLDAKIAVDV